MSITKKAFAAFLLGFFLLAGAGVSFAWTDGPYNESDVAPTNTLSTDMWNAVAQVLKDLTNAIDIDSNGNVGIGKTDPSKPLDVVGEVKADGFCMGTDCISAWPTGGTGTVGPAGPKGDTGDTGPAGAQGVAGTTGAQGVIGNTGPQGPAGPSGATNAAGSTGEVQFNNGGSFWTDENLFWDNTNKRLGIGNSNPQDFLHITGNEDTVGGLNRASLQITDSGTASSWRLQTFGSASAEGGGKFGINLDGDGNKFIIQQNGNVGIGTTGPNAILEVVKTSSIPNANTNGYVRFFDTDDSNGPHNGELSYNGGPDSIFNFKNIGDVTGKTSFTTGPTDGSSSLGIMTLKNNGNVGIGTTTPNARLEVTDHVRISGVSANIQLNDTDHNNFLMHLNNNKLYFMHDKNSNMTWDEADSHKIVMAGHDSGVRLGVGISSPITKLDVNGTVRIDQGGLYDVWIQGGATTGGGDARNLAMLGEKSTDQLRINHNSEYTGGTRIDGKVGIGGSPAASAVLDVKGAVYVDGVPVIDAGGGWHRSYGNTGWFNGTHGGGWYMTDSTWIRNFGSKNLYMGTQIIRTDGQLQVGADGDKFLVDNAGNATAAGNVTGAAFLYSSDRNLKTNIENIESPLEKLSAMRGVTFDWKDSEKEDIGVIAQEVEAVIPQAVQTNNEGLKSVDYARLVPVLIESVNAQQKQIETLRAEIEELKK